MPAHTHPASADFTAFKREIGRSYLHPPHLERIDRALEQVSQHVETVGESGIGRLAIFIPPRHGKSQTVARYFPAWFIGRNPDKRIILTGYGEGLVDKHSRAARNTILTEPYKQIFPNVAIASDSASRVAWDVANHEGGMDAVGIGGAITGKGAHLLIIDDPVKNRAEAESANIRDRIWEAYTNDLYTRLEPGGAVVLIMTRWHEDDLAGRLLSHEAEDWHVIRLPALAEPGDPLGREPGDPLWAERYPIPRLMERRRTLGEYGFASLYQQSPTRREGGLFKMVWIEGHEDAMPTTESAAQHAVGTRHASSAQSNAPAKPNTVGTPSANEVRTASVPANPTYLPYTLPSPHGEGSGVRSNATPKKPYTPPTLTQRGRILTLPALRRVVVAVDPSTTGSGDETGIVVAGATAGRDAHAYVLEDGSLSGSPDQWARAVIALYHKYKAHAVIAEVNQGGDMVTTIIRSIDPNVRVMTVRATEGKALRAEPVAALYEQGRVHHVGVFPILEEQMIRWTPNDHRSPDRLDALVWAITDLLLCPLGVGLR